MYSAGRKAMTPCMGPLTDSQPAVGVFTAPRGGNGDRPWPCPTGAARAIVEHCAHMPIPQGIRTKHGIDQVHVLQHVYTFKQMAPLEEAAHLAAAAAQRIYCGWVNPALEFAARIADTF